MYTAVKRAACDRCHRLKMRCIVKTGSGQQGQDLCSRCLVAGTPCHFSVPRKPGRPATKSCSTSNPLLSRQDPSSPETTVPTDSVTHTVEEPSRVGEGSFAADESFAMRIENFTAGIGLDETSWPMLTLPDEFLHKYGTQSSPEAGCHLDGWAAEYHHYGQFAPGPSGTLPETPLSLPGNILESVQHADDPGVPSLTSQSQPFMSVHSPQPNTSMASKGARHYWQRLSDFNTQLSRAAVDMSSAGSPTQIEQAAAPVLKNSAIFLDLIKCLPGLYSLPGTESTQEAALEAHFSNRSAKQTSTRMEEDEGGNSNEDDEITSGSTQTSYFEPDMATILQLVVFSMRLTELHHDLYLAIYRYLQQQQHSPHSNTVTTSASPRRTTEPSLRLPVSLSIAGFSVTPNPRFQLHLLLQSAVHYLGSIHEALGGLKALRVDMPESMHLPPYTSGGMVLLLRMLMMQDWQGRISSIREILRKLNDDFGMATRI